jgi:hypothetical protein
MIELQMFAEMAKRNNALVLAASPLHSPAPAVVGSSCDRSLFFGTFPSSRSSNGATN